jgi:cytochrome d ubiquinol oxidase subunit II
MTSPTFRIGPYPLYYRRFPRATPDRRDAPPFAMTVLFFLASFATLAVLLWPHMIPYPNTAVRSAPRRGFRFCSRAGLLVLPVVTIYSTAVYWPFRGKIRPTGSYADTQGDDLRR